MTTKTSIVIAVTLLGALAAACGNSTPTTPTPLPNLAGNWTGTLESSNFQTRVVEVTMAQADGSINGNWTSASSDWNGTISGTVSGSAFIGTFTFSGPSFTGIGARCTGNASVSGPVSTGTAAVRWTSTGFTGSCSDMPATLVWNLQRR